MRVGSPLICQKHDLVFPSDACKVPVMNTEWEALRHGVRVGYPST